MPSWFKIPTPIGSYNPDWALVFEDEKKVYFVAETKSTGMLDVDFSKLHKHEQLKIVCGKAHFAEFENIEYKVVNSVEALLKLTTPTQSVGRARRYCAVDGGCRRRHYRKYGVHVFRQRRLLCGCL